MFGLSRSAADVEARVNRLYKAVEPIARRYHCVFRRHSVTPGGLPTVLLLGNHSSGKSTIVNDLLGDPPVQETGVAPTDDAFTVLLFGEEEREFFGPAALGQAPAEFQGLAALGPDFLQHFAVKFRNREFLKKVQLVDSPGMIDTPAGSVARAYDFTGAVKALAETSDLVLFLFDPEKPGTTGETVDVLSACLRGIEFKLRVLLNKADTFDSMEDYARAYGTLCWNLARVLRTKDLPPVYSTFTPSTAARLAARVPLDSFERNRGRILDLLRNAGTRRLDSVIAGATADFSRLSLQARVLGAVRRRLFASGAAAAGVAAAATAATAFAGWFFLVRKLASDASAVSRVMAWGGASVAAAAVLAVAAAIAAFRQKRLRARLAGAEGLDGVFRSIHAHRAAVSGVRDVEPWWDEVRPDVSRIVAAGLHLPLFSWGDFARIDRMLSQELPELAAAPRSAAGA